MVIHRQLARRNARRGLFGFTLIEMLIVISIILILLSLAIPAYQKTVVRAHEAVLRDNLFQMRSLIEQYTLDKNKAPQSLDDLVSAGYLKSIPKDITGSSDTWVVVQDDTIMSPDQSESGIADVHSGSDQVSSEGTAYSSW
jgi:general secretion pathway protein G